MSARCLCLPAVIVALLGSAQAGPDVDNPKVTALLKERLTTLREVETLTQNLFRSGRVSFDAVVQATTAALEAELDLCQTQKERVAVLEKALDVAKDGEAHAKAAVETARAPVSDALKAKANRLKVEIALERAKQK